MTVDVIVRRGSCCIDILNAEADAVLMAIMPYSLASYCHPNLVACCTTYGWTGIDREVFVNETTAVPREEAMAYLAKLKIGDVNLIDSFDPKRLAE